MEREREDLALLLNGKKNQSIRGDCYVITWLPKSFFKAILSPDEGWMERFLTHV